MKTNWLTHKPQDEREELLLLRAREKALAFILSSLAVIGMITYLFAMLDVGRFGDAGPVIWLILILFLGVLIIGKNGIKLSDIEYTSIDVTSWKYLAAFWVTFHVVTAVLFALFDELYKSMQFETVYQLCMFVSTGTWLYYVNRQAPIYYKLILIYPIISVIASIYHSAKGKPWLSQIGIVSLFILPFFLPWIGILIGNI